VLVNGSVHLDLKGSLRTGCHPQLEKERQGMGALPFAFYTPNSVLALLDVLEDCLCLHIVGKPTGTHNSNQLLQRGFLPGTLCTFFPVHLINSQVGSIVPADMVGLLGLLGHGHRNQSQKLTDYK
jgi:hypothetical protein